MRLRDHGRLEAKVVRLGPNKDGSVPGDRRTPEVSHDHGLRFRHGRTSPSSLSRRARTGSIGRTRRSPSDFELTGLKVKRALARIPDLPIRLWACPEEGGQIRLTKAGPAPAPWKLTKTLSLHSFSDASPPSPSSTLTLQDGKVEIDGTGRFVAFVSTIHLFGSACLGGNRDRHRQGGHQDW